jgi:hypothetical protein
VLSYLRQYKDEAVLVVLNMSAAQQKASFDLKPHGISAGQANTLLTTLAGKPRSVVLSDISLEPFAVYIAEVSRKPAAPGK